MAKVQVASDDGRTVVEILTSEDGITEYVCPCGESDSVRGRFQDTIEAARIHVDIKH